MYSKTDMYVKYFIDENAVHTDKLFKGKVSETIKSTSEGGKASYSYETWQARFVGKAYAKAKTLPNMAKIKLTEWSARNPYNKDSKTGFPHIIVFDFEKMGE